jgi:hypothetical protein
VTWGLRALVVLAAAVLVTTALATDQRTYRRVVFIAVIGQGKVTTKPAGLTCPGHCRAIFLKDQHVKFIGHPAPGWKLVKWSGSCIGKLASCGFWVADSHDCANGMCPIGAFGEHVTFARIDGGG